MTDPHTTLLALAGAVPDGWLAVARAALAADDADTLSRLFDALAVVAQPGEDRAPEGRFGPGPDGHTPADRAAAAAVADLPVTACWRAVRDGADAVYLVQTAPDADLPAVAATVQRALAGAGEASPRVEVFGPGTPLPGYHEAALAAAALLWTAAPVVPVRVARTFDGATPEGGPYFSPTRELVVDVEERQRLLDFLGGGEVVAPLPGVLPDLLSASGGPVPADLRSDGSWVWSDAAGYYLDRHLVRPDDALAEHAARAAGPAPLTHLDRHRVRAALVPDREEGPLWLAG
ncbi:hypothetical protein ACTG9Q_27620 [Actinokineospora sp. 24-640]